MSKNYLILLSIIVCLFSATTDGLKRSQPRNIVNDPNPNPLSVLVVGDNARFTFLTPQLVRIQYLANPKNSSFDDRATLGVINRNLPAVNFTSSITANVAIMETEALRITYTLGGAASPPFSADTLSIELLGKDGIKTNWSVGDVNSGNLLGTIRTLDGVNGTIDLNCTTQSRTDLHCTFGLISTLGWNLVDESQRPVYTSGGYVQDWEWVESNANSQDLDWYFMGYGHNFKQALYDYTTIGGSIPLPPRFSFGTWWSRYWAFSDVESIDIINQYIMHDVPLDVFVTDMDWHITFYAEASKGIVDQAGYEIGWTGYTWDDHLFNDPAGFLAYCKGLGLKNTLNLHPASGIQPWEERYPQMAKTCGIDPSSKKYVPFDPYNQTWASEHWNIMLQPIEEQGIDFWWLDWQQGEDVTDIAGLNPTFWLNYIFFTNPDQWANNKRPVLFHRWGGLGNHRYQLGFTGDVVPSWESLAFQPYFTATAANVGFAYWSHDIGGHTLPSPPEVYTRWLQWGAFAPILRTHCTKNSDNDRRIWTYPLTNFFIMRDAMVLRSELVPYVYTASRIAHDTGVAFLRPLYYDYTSHEAYQTPGEYIFGDDMVVYPVTAPVNPNINLTEWNVWVPPGNWIEWFSGLGISGPLVITRPSSLEDIPVYVKAGAVIPLVSFQDRPVTGGAKLLPVTQTFRIFTCGANCGGEGDLYEDDGDSTLYLSSSSSFAWTNVAFSSTDQQLTAVVNPPNTTFSGLPSDRNYRIIFQGAYDPSSVTVDGDTVPFDPTGQTAPSWSYDGSSLSIEVITSLQDITLPVKVSVEMSHPFDDNLYSGIPLAINRLVMVKALLDQQWGTNVYQESYETVIDGASTGVRMSFNPSTVYDTLTSFNTTFYTALTEVRNMTSLTPTVQHQASALISNAAPGTYFNF